MAGEGGCIAVEPSRVDVMAPDDLVPFGKYKGLPVLSMLQDVSYCNWFLNQEWAPKNYLKVYNFIVNAGGQVDDTPEHNKLQARFLDESFRVKTLRLVGICNDSGYLPFRQGTKVCNIEFEVEGWDVELKLRGPEFKRVRGVSGALVYWGGHFPTVYCELKPSVGDDFPTVLRQMKVNRKRLHDAGPGYMHCNDVCCLVYGGYTGTGVTEEQMREMISESGFRVARFDEIDAVSVGSFNMMTEVDGCVVSDDRKDGDGYPKTVSRTITCPHGCEVDVEEKVLRGNTWGTERTVLKGVTFSDACCEGRCVAFDSEYGSWRKIASLMSCPHAIES